MTRGGASFLPLVICSTSYVGVTVRRERRWTSVGASPTRELGSLHPVAIETAAEATKLSELSM